jgi:hypothetical protein
VTVKDRCQKLVTGYSSLHDIAQQAINISFNNKRLTQHALELDEPARVTQAPSCCERAACTAAFLHCPHFLDFRDRDVNDLHDLSLKPRGS